ncbi:MAG: 50S ribosomal protein L10 [Thermomicrobiales bacterium]
MPTTKKAGTIEELTEALRNAQLTIVTDYRGLKVSDLQGFRAALRPKGADFRVAKNTLTNIAAGQAGIEGFGGMLEGPTGLVIVRDDIVGASKVVNDFVRTSRVLAVKGAVMNNRALSAADIEELATLPSREELQAKLLGLMVSPMSRTLGVLGGPARSFVYLLNAKTEQSGSAAAD